VRERGKPASFTDNNGDTEQLWTIIGTYSSYGHSWEHTAVTDNDCATQHLQTIMGTHISYGQQLEHTALTDNNGNTQQLRTTIGTYSSCFTANSCWTPKSSASTRRCAPWNTYPATSHSRHVQVRAACASHGLTKLLYR